MAHIASRLVAVFAALAVMFTLASCGNNDPSSDGTTLTIYTDQHAALIETLTEAYTKETGVKFNLQHDATPGQIEAEGDRSPADIFLSEDPGTVAQLGKEGRLSTLDDSTLNQVMPGLSSDDGSWVAYGARTRVLYYNPEVIDEADLPTTLMDVIKPRYKGKFAYAPSGAFVATTQYLLTTIGEEATTEFLTKIKENGINEQKNGNVRDTVEAGKHAFGLSNHYYWWIKANEVGGPDNMTSKIYHFPTPDPGNLVLTSGAGILASSSNQAEAAKFVAWLTSPDGGQAIFADEPIEVSGAQYPVAKGTASSVVGSLEDIPAPELNMSIYTNKTEAEELLKSLGISR